MIKLLVVDGNPRSLGVVAAFMREYADDIVVTTTDTPDRALRMYEEGRPDVVAIDASGRGPRLAGTMCDKQPRPYIILMSDVDMPQEQWLPVADTFYNKGTSMNGLLGAVRSVS